MPGDDNAHANGGRVGPAASLFGAILRADSRADYGANLAATTAAIITEKSTKLTAKVSKLKIWMCAFIGE